ncbi:MAG: hypothetical protein ACX94C_09525 [Phycisphaerales bacterium]
MRLPWWPIYIDAQMDEDGVSFHLPDGELLQIPWHRIGRPQGANIKNHFSIYDERLKPLRHSGKLIVVRVPNQTSTPQRLQQQFIQSRAYTLDIHPSVIKADKRRYVLMPIVVTIYPLLPLIMGAIAWPISVPDNEIGQRVHIATLLFLGIMGLCCLGLLCASVHNWYRIKNVSSLTRVGSDSITFTTARGETCTVPKSGLRAQPSWSTIFFHTTQGERIFVPPRRHVLQLLPDWFSSRHVNGISMRFSIAMILLSLSTGPVAYLWNQYLIPEEHASLGVGAYFAFSSFGVLLMLILLVAVRVAHRIEKSGARKSE